MSQLTTLSGATTPKMRAITFTVTLDPSKFYAGRAERISARRETLAHHIRQRFCPKDKRSASLLREALEVREEKALNQAQSAN
jgi:hypothetical protein